jgi:filamentous hemagglutinin family protein
MFAHSFFNVRSLAFSLQQIGTRGFSLTALAAIPGLALAELPSSGTVVGGAASIANLDANRQRITQTTDRAIINWQTFSIGASDYVQFIQPSTSSVTLNRVTGGTPSSILGSLSANGQVFLVNPNGVYFGPGSQIDVAGLVATTLDIGDGDFMAGRYVFSRDPASPARAEVINRGVIAAREGGYVVLAGDYAANSGAIQARLGTVALAAGSKLTLDLAGDRLISYSVDEKTLAQLAGVSNTGQLMADGGRVFMTAKVAGDLAATVVNSEGLVQAQSTVESNGEIYLAAEGGGIRVTGTLDASAQPGANGGHVSVVSRGGGNTVIASGSLIKVSGNDLAVSNAGSVYTWADGTTRFEKGAAIEARGGASGGDGGFIEVSGQSVIYRGTVDARAPHGRRGTLLIDPNEIVIAQGSGSDTSATIYEQNLEATLQSGGADVVLEATGSNARITVADLSANSGDGILDGRNAGSGAGLEFQVNGSGAPAITFANTANTIAVDGNLTMGWTSGTAAPAISVGNLIARNIAIGTSSQRVAEVSVGALTASPRGSGDGDSSSINIFADGNINLNGPISIRSNGSNSSGAYLNVQTTGGNILHAGGLANAITVGHASDSAGAAAQFEASSGTVSLGHVSALSNGRPARITISGDQGVTLAGPITVRGQGSSWSGTGANLEVRASNGNISHTAGTVEVTNTNGSGGAVACFMAGTVGNCSGSGSPSGNARTITLQNVIVTSDNSSGSGWAKIGVNATGGITLQDDVTAQGRYSASVGLYTHDNSAGIALADSSKTIKAYMTDAASGSGAKVEIFANNGGNVDLAGALEAYAAGSSGANIQVQGGSVSVGAITAGNASPSAVGHRANVQIQSQSGDITLNGPITVTGNSNSGSGAYLYVQSAADIVHAAGSATAISVRNYNPSNGGAYAEFRATGTATVGRASVRGFEGADLTIRALGGISVVDDLTATADGGGAQVGLYRDSGGSPGSIPISLATGKTIRAIATGSSGGGAYVDINGNGGGGGDVITLNGSLIAEGGATSGNASISVSGGDVTLGVVTATAGNSAQIYVTGTNITLGAGLTAADSIQLRPDYNGATGNISGNGYSLLTNRLHVIGGSGGGVFDLTTNAANLELYGGTSVTVNAAAQTGALTAILGCGGSGGSACGGPGSPLGNTSITAGGSLNITQFYTIGTTHLLRADTLTLPGGGITMPAGAAVTLKPYTLTNTVGVYSDTDAAINTQYSDTLLNLFAAGTSFTLGGAVGGQLSGNIHVGADGAFNLGDKNIVFDTSGRVVTHNAPTTTGTVTIIAPVVPVPPIDPVVPVPPIDPVVPVTPPASEVEPEVTETFTSVVADLDHAAGGNDPAGNNEAGRSLAGLFLVGGAGYSPPPVLFEIKEN